MILNRTEGFNASRSLVPTPSGVRFRLSVPDVIVTQFAGESRHTNTRCKAGRLCRFRDAWNLGSSRKFG